MFVKSFKIKKWEVTINVYHKGEKNQWYGGEAYDGRKYFRWQKDRLLGNKIRALEGGIPLYVLKAIEKELAD